MANRQDRARQFMPFASLKGYFDKIREQERIKEPKRELSDSAADELSMKLNQIKKNDMVRITYYNEDHYEEIEGVVSNIDCTFRKITIVKTVVKIEDILDVNS